MRNYPKITDLTEPAVVGRRYLVPVIEYPWHNRFDIWPVWPPKHHDREVGFEWEHYHVDGRFLTGRQWRWLGSQKFVKSGRPRDFWIVSSPLATTGNYPGNRLMPHPEPGLRLLKLLRQFDYPSDYILERYGGDAKVGVVEISRRHIGKSLADPEGRQICPHKGAALASVPRDADGGVTCPLHGLSFGPDHVCVGLRRRPKEGAAE